MCEFLRLLNKLNCNLLFFVKFVDINNSFISSFFVINNIQLSLATLPMFLTKIVISKLFSMRLYFQYRDIFIFIVLEYKTNSFAKI